MAIMSGGCPSLVMVIASGAPRPDVMTIAQAARGAIIQPARLHGGTHRFAVDGDELTYESSSAETMVLLSSSD